MKILMFSSDPENSRLAKYAEVLEKLEIIDMSRKQGRFARFWKGYQRAKNILAHEQFDLITAQDIEHSFISWILSSRFGVPFEMQIHTDIFSPYFVLHAVSNMIRVLLTKFLLPRAGCVRVVSERIKRSLGRDAAVLPIFSQAKTSGGVNIKEKYPGYDLYILMASRLSREKNIQLALRAMREVVKKVRALLVIVGDGPEADKLKKETLIGLEANVRFEGWQENLGGYYASADVLLVTSNYEGYCLAAVEAIAAGLPVIMTNVGVAGEFVRDGANGIVVLVGDRSALVGAILKFFENPSLRLKLREGALATKPPYNSFEDYREKLINSWRTCQK